MVAAGFGWIAGLYRALAPMSPRDVDELFPWEAAAMMGIDHTDGRSGQAEQPKGMQIGAVFGGGPLLATATKGGER